MADDEALAAVKIRPARVSADIVGILEDEWFDLFDQNPVSCTLVRELICRWSECRSAQTLSS